MFPDGMHDKPGTMPCLRHRITINSHSFRRRLQGHWVLEDITIDGENERNSGSMVGNVAVTRASFEWPLRTTSAQVRSSEKVHRELKYTLYSDKSPKEFDAEYVGSDVKQKEYFRGGMKGIYSLDGDRLIRCYADPGQPRPTECDSKQGSRRTLSILKRKPPPNKQ